MSKRSTKIVSVLVMAVVALSIACAVAFTNVQVSRPMAASARYTSDYASKAEAIEAGDKLNERIAEEGMVLLKNANNTLPLDPGGVGSDATGVTLFGYKSVVPEGGASPNDTDASAGVTITTTDFYSSLAAAGYRTNPVVKAAYTNWMSENTENNTSDFAAITETDTTGIKRFTNDVKYSFSDYDDAAIVVLSATGAATTKDGRAMAAAGTGARHAHSLDNAQKALLEYADANFDKVIVLINDSTPMELAYVKEKADAILLVGNPGATGFAAVGRLLSGQVNPSGKTADIYPADFTKDPTFYNIGRNAIEPVTPTRDNPDITPIAGGNQYVDQNGNPLYGYYADYEEGIYVGYRYYETMAAEIGEEWYDDNVVFAFGEGYSYTTFDWAATANAGVIADPDQKITVNVTVTNTGDVSGKDVVELYYSAPYDTESNLEKSAVVLGDFAKTDELAADGSQTVKLTLKARDMASYDVEANNGNGAYVLEKGTYTVSLRTSSHDVKSNDLVFEYTVNEEIVIAESDQTGKAITNAFDDLKGLGAKETATTTHAGSKGFKELSRDDMTAASVYQPQRRSLYSYNDAIGLDSTARETGSAAANNVLTINETVNEFADWLVVVDSSQDSDNDGIIDYDEGQPWAVAEEDMPTYADAATRPAEAEVVLSDLIGKGYDDPLWEDLLDQLTIDEMISLVEYGGFKSNAIPYIGKPETLDTDSPLGWSGNGTAGQLSTRFATEPVMACTWSKKLAYEMGVMMGDQGLWGRSDTGSSVKAYTGWYGPGMNTHRSPFLSRYTEYYSEDGYLAGMMAANATLGAAEKGCYSFIKHFALHEDGSTDRGIFFGGAGSETSGLSIWASEQAVREIYLKPFQIAVEVGGATAAMASFSRFGSEWAGGSYGLMTQVLRNEWGFEGFVVTDIAIYDFLNAEQMIRAGCDLVLDAAVYGMPLPVPSVLDRDNLTATKVMALRNVAKHVCFTVANSNAMDIPHGAAVTFNGGKLADAKVGTAYTAKAEAALNTVYSYDATISYAVTAGALPAGMTFADGTVSGTPTRAGEYSFTVTATADGFASGVATFVITVDPEKTTSDIVDGAIDGSTSDINGKIDGAVGDLNDKISATDEKVDGVSSLVVVALVFGIIAALASVVAVVLAVIKKK